MARKKTRQEFINEAVAVHGNKYDYSKVEYKENKTKVEIICPDHGPFWQKPNNHLNGQGCGQCNGGYRSNEETFKQKAREVHGNKYDYSKVHYQTSQTKAEIICPIHGSFYQKPNNHLNGRGCPECASHKGGVSRTTESFIKDAVKTHGEKYDYSNVIYRNNKTKVEIICSVHGPFLQKPNNHLIGQGCPDCSGKKRKTIEQFIKEARNIHGNLYDYSLIQYKNNRTPVEIVCPHHGSFFQVPYAHSQGVGCPHCFGDYYSFKWLERNQHLKDHYCSLYLLEMNNENESFLKVGITRNSVDIRYKNEPVNNYYAYRIIEEVPLTMESAIALERDILYQFNAYRYFPFYQFGGWTECFTSESCDGILGLLSEEGE